MKTTKKLIALLLAAAMLAGVGVVTAGAADANGELTYEEMDETNWLQLRNGGNLVFENYKDTSTRYYLKDMLTEASYKYFTEHYTIGEFHLTNSSIQSEGDLHYYVMFDKSEEDGWFCIAQPTGTMDGELRFTPIEQDEESGGFHLSKDTFSAPAHVEVYSGSAPTEEVWSQKVAAASTALPFADVASGAWYENDLRAAYGLGLVNGVSSTAFDPNGSVTIAQAIAFAARLHNLYHGEIEELKESGSKWYYRYTNYARLNHIVEADEFTDFDAIATRAQFASILARALPEDALKQINDVADGAIPDVSMDSEYADEIYTLYRAGVLVGIDGVFAPNTSVKRSEVATILARMLDTSRRISA